MIGSIWWICSNVIEMLVIQFIQYSIKIVYLPNVGNGEGRWKGTENNIVWEI